MSRFVETQCHGWIGHRQCARTVNYDASAWPPAYPVPLCSQHESDLICWADRRQEERANRLWAERQAKEAEAEAEALVYFLQRADGRVKIGFTKHLRARIRSLEKEHGPLVLLGQRQGGRNAEWDLHQRFARVRLGRTEWFEPIPSLLSYAAGCRFKAAA